ncbi:bifunctional riboflavin kinase/FAD synthetase [Hyphococcus sp. DH-69]|uniref:bifunctional riboflavin kinase/FAD synthetase n=1 Tax=Hyphococcus formosus TaxID=3143534 RepID=UPI00398BA46F
MVKPIIAAVGNFDGVHRGHQFLLDETAKFAQSFGAEPGVVLFDPHPRRYFRPNDPPFLLTTPKHRDALLRRYSAKEVYALTFDETLATMPPGNFIEDVLKKQLGLAGVVAGADFRFGAGRAGDGEMLKERGEELGLKVKLVDVISNGSGADKFGSSDVRKALLEGDVQRAAEILGRPWSVVATVEEGRKLGRTIGFPTANMMLGEIIAPRQGVYACRATVDGKTYDAVSNFGRRPTVGADAPLLETNFFDFDSDLYGREIEVEFIAFLREEKKFNGLEELSAQIALDCKQAKEILSQ